MKLSKKGFTLIELLVVIAVLGVLATVLLIAIDPIEQLARGRDAGRKQALGQLGNALLAYNTTLSTWPTVNPTWITSLQAAGEIKSIPVGPNYGVSGTAQCAGLPTASAQGTGTPEYCFEVDTSTPPNAIAYVRLESKLSTSLCVAPNFAYFYWSSKDGRSGIVCGTEPLGFSGLTYY